MIWWPDGFAGNNFARKLISWQAFQSAITVNFHKKKKAKRWGISLFFYLSCGTILNCETTSLASRKLVDQRHFNQWPKSKWVPSSRMPICCHYFLFVTKGRIKIRRTKKKLNRQTIEWIFFRFLFIWFGLFVGNLIASLATLLGKYYIRIVGI